ncbi:sugar ABC transporter ATP-binding protein [Xylanibacillus composti]|uniref:Ribose import ATP-binding protein RbsA n=1 Tax=Xylanibacillus composti TaxID=1572762 RepID=A0A8J4H3G4_9BACL|nr:sugar ABC transporter ATP-binding protein [Xylanibacillus composti]MDT9726531.1 sugar ABC transporter ATP-binding protein [Xylanibacillus composti]GIQ68950.1 ribose import ATP-binding protein RbsA [Xylanibacillus composti]
MSEAELLRMDDICKSFGPNVILKDVHFTLLSGQVHALLGANGAGKSTLMKIISGVYTLDSGSVTVQGKQVSIQSPADAKRHGISIIHQELSLVPEMTVAENIYLGKEASANAAGMFFSKGRLEACTEKLLGKYGIPLDPRARVRDLSIGHQQLVEIMKAVSDESNILIMDEPTATLTTGETEQLFTVIRSLKDKGIGMVYISHRLDEIQEICDYVSILKDGRNTAEGPIRDFSSEKIIEHMIGKQLEHYYPSSDRVPGQPVLELSKVTKGHVLNQVSLQLRSGEVLGLFGLLGAGQTELLKVVFGAEEYDEGEIRIQNQAVRLDSPAKAKAHGIALVTENRKEEGLVLEQGTASNIALASMRRLSRWGIKKDGRIRSVANHYVEALNIKLSSIREPVKNLSGGNQQKAILGKWLYTEPNIVLLSEPTRGIDIGARSEIYHLLSDLADQGRAVMVASSDADEILGMCDRILVMFNGNVIAELKREEANEELLMEYASGAREKKEVKQ